MSDGIQGVVDATRIAKDYILSGGREMVVDDLDGAGRGVGHDGVDEMRGFSETGNSPDARRSGERQQH